MNIATMLIAGTAKALLSVLEVCMLLRAILSWFPVRDDNPILLFACMVTEPIVAPVRALFDHFGWFEDSPLDVSFLAAYLLLSIVTAVVAIFA